MAKSKPKKRKAVKHSIAFAENLAYWQPIHAAIMRKNLSAAIALADTSLPDDALEAALIDPIEMAITRFVGGYAKFPDYWIIVQGVYCYAHLLTDALVNQQYRIFDKDGVFPDKLNELVVEYHLRPYRAQLDRVETDFQETISNIYDRQSRVGKFGLTGDELKVVQEVVDGLKDLMTWVSTAMIYRAGIKCCDRLSDIEHSIRKKYKGKTL